MNVVSSSVFFRFVLFGADKLSYRSYCSNWTCQKSSVILPAYNAPESIGRAVHSLLDQTFRAIEVIVVDDGSTDDTGLIVQRIRDPRIRLVQCPHRHVVAAANTAIEFARGPLIARMDADDFSHPRRLEKQVDLLYRRDLDVVGCQVHIINSVGQVASTMQRYERWINEETIAAEQILALRFVEFPLVNPTIMARRSYFEMGFR